MLVTIVTVQRGTTQVHQFEAATVKDGLVAWAGRIAPETLTDVQRTRLRGAMADFAEPPLPGFGNVWRLTTRLGEGPDAEAVVLVIETARS